MSYVPLDSNGRTITHAEVGKRFLRAHKAAIAFFAEHPDGRLYLGPDAISYRCVKSLAEYREANRELLDTRINVAGNADIREPRDGEWPLRRDKRAIEDLLLRRIRGNGLETKTARKRFPEIHARMKER